MLGFVAMWLGIVSKLEFAINVDFVFPVPKDELKKYFAWSVNWFIKFAGLRKYEPNWTVTLIYCENWLIFE